MLDPPLQDSFCDGRPRRERRPEHTPLKRDHDGNVGDTEEIKEWSSTSFNKPEK